MIVTNNNLVFGDHDLDLQRENIGARIKALENAIGEAKKSYECVDRVSYLQSILEACLVARRELELELARRGVSERLPEIEKLVFGES